MQQLAKFRARRFSEYRIVVVEKGAVDLLPVLGGEHLGSKREDVSFLNANVFLLIADECTQGLCHLAGWPLAGDGVIELLPQCRQFALGVVVIGLHVAERFVCLITALAQQAEQVVGLFWVMHAVDELFEVLGFEAQWNDRCT